MGTDCTKATRRGFPLGMVTSDEPLAVQSLHLHRAELRFATGIIPVVATAVHRQGDAFVLEQVFDVVACLLTPLPL